jgi:hypothetical protein
MPSLREGRVSMTKSISLAYAEHREGTCFQQVFNIKRGAYAYKWFAFFY